MATNSIGKNNVLISLAVDKDALKRLDALAAHSKISRSEYLRGVIIDATNRRLIVTSQVLVVCRPLLEHHEYAMPLGRITRNKS